MRVKTLAEHVGYTRDKRFTEHEGPYGEACINTGQFDAGECWKCQIRRLEAEVLALQARISEREARCEATKGETG